MNDIEEGKEMNAWRVRYRKENFFSDVEKAMSAKWITSTAKMIKSESPALRVLIEGTLYKMREGYMPFEYLFETTIPIAYLHPEACAHIIATDFAKKVVQRWPDLFDDMSAEAVLKFVVRLGRGDHNVYAGRYDPTVTWHYDHLNGAVMVLGDGV